METTQKKATLSGTSTNPVTKQQRPTKSEVRRIAPQHWPRPLYLMRLGEKNTVGTIAMFNDTIECWNEAEAQVGPLPNADWVGGTRIAWDKRRRRLILERECDGILYCLWVKHWQMWEPGLHSFRRAELKRKNVKFAIALYHGKGLAWQDLHAQGGGNAIH